MAKGMDFNCCVSGNVEQLKQDGCAFVGRYYNHNNPSKNLTRTEAETFSKAGLYIVAVWENGFPIGPTYFTHSRGVFDGVSAYHYALHEIGQPAQTPIYFTVDYDASESQISGCVLEYINGICDGFASISKGAPEYTIGVYGSGAVCETVSQLEKSVTHTWLAISRGWSGSQTFGRWNIKQGEQTRIGEVSGDLDESNGDAGGWRLNAE